MLLAAKETIRHILMVLPNTTQAFLYTQRIGELPYLLKLINAYYKSDTKFLSYTLWKIQNFFWRIILWRYSQ